MTTSFNQLTAQDIHARLSNRVIGQDAAKRAVSVALLHRTISSKMPKDEIVDYSPTTNVLLKGPTGSGKTEIMRSIESELQIPVATVAATSITPPGVVGTDAEDVVKQLYFRAEKQGAPQWFLDDLKRQGEYGYLPKEMQCEVLEEIILKDLTQMKDLFANDLGTHPAGIVKLRELIESQAGEILKEPPKAGALDLVVKKALTETLPETTKELILHSKVFPLTRFFDRLAVFTLEKYEVDGINCQDVQHGLQRGKDWEEVAIDDILERLWDTDLGGACTIYGVDDDVIWGEAFLSLAREFIEKEQLTINWKCQVKPACVDENTVNTLEAILFFHKAHMLKLHTALTGSSPCVEDHSFYAHFPGVPTNGLDRTFVNPVIKRYIEEYGVIFIDEVDKLISDSPINGTEIQKLLLTLIEGTQVSLGGTHIDTSKILFIAGGAFHFASEDKLVPELRGRLNTISYLHKLTKDNIKEIFRLNSGSYQSHKRRLEYLGVDVSDIDSHHELIASIVVEENKNSDIGARRINDVLQQVFEPVYFSPENYQTSLPMPQLLKEAGERRYSEQDKSKQDYK